MLRKMVNTTTKSLKPKSLIYSIEGNLASGKSLVLDNLMLSKRLSIITCKEPIDEWMNMKSGSDLLKCFYEENQRWSFAFENLVQLSRAKTHYQSLQNAVGDDSARIFTERSLWSSFHVFCRNSLDEQRITQPEYDILAEHYKFFSKSIAQLSSCNNNQLPFQVIYLRTQPMTCLTRMRKRNRSSECSVDLSYLTQINDKYETWINGLIRADSSMVKIIDADQDITSVIKQIQMLDI